jgi:hypothetical protein
MVVSITNNQLAAQKFWLYSWQSKRYPCVLSFFVSFFFELLVKFVFIGYLRLFPPGLKLPDNGADHPLYLVSRLMS